MTNDVLHAEGPATGVRRDGRTTRHLSRSARVPALDGLRGIAVLAVLGYHLFPTQLPGGFLGVDLFFVLSGYLITSGLSAEIAANGRPRFGWFWLRRARRILPALLVLLATVCAVVGITGGAVEVRLKQQVLAGATFVSNWYQSGLHAAYADRFQPPIFQHLWSLAVEEQFYLLWPLVVWLLLVATRRPARAWLWVAALATASATAMAVGFRAGVPLNRLYFGSDTHGFPLLLGSAAALWAAGRRHRPAEGAPARATRWPLSRSWTEAAALAGCLLAIARLGWDAPATYLGGGAFFAAVVAVLVVRLADPSRPQSVVSPVDTLLTWSALRWAGRRSYGLYLWHWPVIIVTMQVAPKLGPLAVAAVAVPLTLGLAALSWRFVEYPIQRHGFRHYLRTAHVDLGRVGRHALVGVTAAAVAVVGLGATALANSQDASALDSALSAGEAAIAQHQTTVDPPSDSGPHPTHPGGSTPGRRGSPGPSTRPPGHPKPKKSGTATGQRANGQRANGQKSGGQQAGGQRVNGQGVTVIGDSVAVAAAPALYKRMPRVDVHAHVGMQMWDLKATIQDLSRRGTLGRIVVVALGTNGDFAYQQLDDAVRAAGTGHRFVLVTASGPRSWIPPADAKMRKYANTHQQVVLADWNASRSRVRDFAPGGIHPGPQGAAVFAGLIADAVASADAR